MTQRPSYTTADLDRMDKAEAARLYATSSLSEDQLLYVMKATTNSALKVAETNVQTEMLKTMERQNEYALFSWKKEADIFEKSFDEISKRSCLPETKIELQRTLDNRSKSKFPLSQDMVYILTSLLHLNGENPHIILADLLLNKSADERLMIHNWAIHRDPSTPETMKDAMAKAISSGKLRFPLFFGSRMTEQNRMLLEEALSAKQASENPDVFAMASMQGGGPPMSNRKKKDQFTKSASLFEAPPTHGRATLVGGDPWIAVVDTNREAVGYWDGADIQGVLNNVRPEALNLEV